MEDYIKLLLERGYTEEDITRNKRATHITINGVKTELHFYSRMDKPWEFRIGYGNSSEDIETLAELVTPVFGEDSVSIHNIGYVKITKKTVEEWEVLVDFIENLEFTPEKKHSNRSEAKVGAIFEGTVFGRTKERGASIGGKFGKMVCEASGMDRDEMLPEYYTDAGEIDGVEVNENGEVISIYECQSGIHKGQYLDDLHLNKALGKYLYDPQVIPTVQKVVILAGGYSEDTLGIIKERSNELLSRKNPIRIVLLETVRIEDSISVVEKQY